MEEDIEDLLDEQEDSLAYAFLAGYYGASSCLPAVLNSASKPNVLLAKSWAGKKW